MELSYIISPAKKMNVVEGPPYVEALPRFMARTAQIVDTLQAMGYDELKALWRCSDALARLNYERLSGMDVERDLTAAVIAYEGIQYQHLAAGVLDEASLAWLQGHLRILSGLYGVVRPFDGVVPYRLEMGAKLSVGGSRDLYDYWGSALYDALAQECDLIVNLASVEYAKAVTRWVRPDGPQVLTCLFGSVAASGRFVQRATEAKAARGTFVRWCAERGVEDVAELRSFCERGYVLDEGRSSEDELVFVRAGN